MGITSEKNFDCVKFMREARGRIDAATAGMTDEERLHWYKSREYTDPRLAKMAGRMPSQNSASSEESRGN